MEAISRTGHIEKMKIAIDVAATEFCIGNTLILVEYLLVTAVMLDSLLYYKNYFFSWFLGTKYDLDFKNPNKSGQNFKSGDDMTEMYKQLCAGIVIIFLLFCTFLSNYADIVYIVCSLLRIQSSYLDCSRIPYCLNRGSFWQRGLGTH